MENFVVSARKYRPSTFGTVVGQPSIVQTLKNAIRNNTLAQAFLFTGPRGIGKTTCARILAKTINCLNLQPDTEPCNTCESCRSFNQLASFNIQELDAASNNSVEDIRALADQVRIPPQAGKYKVYIIDEVHMLSQQAFNAFLKTLEEPPAYAKFILATTERHKILPTILSRCQIYDFKRISVTDIAAHLAWVAGQEQVGYEEEALHVIAQKADGALRDALSIFDQIVSFSGKQIRYLDVIENLNLLDYEYYFRVMDAINTHNLGAALLILDEIIDKGFEGHHFVNGLADHLRNLLLCKDPQITKLLEVTESVRSRYQQQATVADMVWLVHALDILSKADLNYKLATNKRLHMELMLMQLSETSRMMAEKKKGDSAITTANVPVSAAQAATSTQAPPPVIQAPEKPVAAPAVVPVAPPASVVGQDQQEPIPAGGAPVASVVSTAPAAPASAAGTLPAKTPAMPGNSAQASEAPPADIHKPVRKAMSIRDLMDADDTDDESSEEDDITEPEGHTLMPLDLPMVQDLVTRYATAISSESPGFAAALLAKPVTLGEGNLVMISFSNKIIAGPEHIKPLQSFLREHITDTWFRVEPVIEEVQQLAKLILSPREKYTRMIVDHPGVEIFAKKLGLEPEE